MFAAETCIGAVNPYSGRPRRWTVEELDAARVLSDMASGYIVNAVRHEEKSRLADQLQHALERRIIIEQAKGVLAARQGISPDAAFDEIRRNARSKRCVTTEVWPIATAVDTERLAALVVATTHAWERSTSAHVSDVGLVTDPPRDA